jgi:hypothetical protein
MTDEVTAGVAANKDEGAMTDPQHQGNGPVNVQPSPMQKAIEGGYKEEPVPSREERAAAVVAELEHAIQHNAPVTLAVLKEIRELLDVPAPDDTPVAEVAEAQV